MNLLRGKHTDGKARLIEMLSSIDGCGLTTDMWTSKATQSYITITCHFIDEKWIMQSFVLETCAFEGRHTADKVGNKLVETATTFGILEGVAGLTHDEAANMVAALDHTQAVVQEQDIPASKWESVVCAAHRLQTCLRHALAKSEEVQETIAAARRLVGHFKHSYVATAALKKKQNDLEMEELKLIQDVATRWNSTFYMLQRLSQQRVPVLAVLNDKTVSKKADLELDLSSQRWALAEELCTALKPFEAATRLLSAEYNVSLSAVLPIVHGLWAKNTTVKHSDSPAIRSVKATLREKLESKFELNELDADSLPMLAAAIDPRFKGLSFLEEEEDKTPVYDSLTDRMVAHTQALQDADASLSEPPTKKAKSSADDWALVGLEDAPGEATSQQQEREGEELARFLKQPTQPLKSDPLRWWKRNASAFPRLAMVAKTILCVTGTSTPAERMFSAGGLVINHHRASLHPRNVDSILFLNKNAAGLFEPSKRRDGPDPELPSLIESWEELQ